MEKKQIKIDIIESVKTMLLSGIYTKQDIYNNILFMEKENEKIEQSKKITKNQ